MKICKNCHAEQENDAIFCMECGFTEFEEETSSPATAEGEKSNQQEIASSNSEMTSVEEIGEVLGKSAEKEDNASSYAADTSGNIVKLNLLDENENVVKTWTLGKLPSYTIGRISSKGSVDVDLSDFEMGKYVSRNHAKVYRTGDEWYYTDLGSKYGTEIITSNSREAAVAKQAYKLRKGMMLILAKKVRFEVG